LVHASLPLLIQFQSNITLNAHKAVPALASDDITGIVKGATWIAVASLTTIMVV
jgi:hypothetical protein